MKTEDLWKQYQSYTRDLTEHSRKLGFAGVAVCWIFRSSSFTFPPLIYWALAFFVAYFISDIFHYLVGAVLTKFHVEKEEFRLLQETGSIDGDVPKPRWLDWPAYGFFIAKAIFMILAFVFIGCELVVRLAH
jgi:hypothetical protein